jgi:hypothetical protein
MFCFYSCLNSRSIIERPFLLRPVAAVGKGGKRHRVIREVFVKGYMKGEMTARRQERSFVLCLPFF